MALVAFFFFLFHIISALSMMHFRVHLCLKFLQIYHLIHVIYTNIIYKYYILYIIQILANKLSKVSFMIKSLKGILSPYMIRNIYFTKFQALLRFGILFWGGRGRELNKRIFRIQKRVIRLMSGVRSRTSCRQL